MDEEELGSTGKKITINNFFESIKSIDKISQRALKFSKKSTEELKVATETLKGLQAIVQSLQIDVESLKESEQIRKNEEEDRRFKEEDAQQKKEMIERAEAVKGEKGDKGDEGEKGEDAPQEEPKKAPQDKGLLNTLFGGLIGAGAMGLGALTKILNPFGARKVDKARNRDSLTKITDEDTPVTSFAKKGGVAGFLNRKLFGGGKDEKDEKDKVKEEIKSEIKDELNFTSKKTSKKLTTRFDREKGVGYVNGQEVDAQKYAEFKRLPPREQLAQGLDFFKEDTEEFSLKGTKDIKPEKKENKLMNFVKRGGVAGFLGKKIFGKKDKENKAQEVGATNPENEGGEDTSYSESFSYKGRLDPATLEFIPDEGALPPGVPLEKAQQDFYRSKIEMLEFDFRSNIMEGMTREEAIESYGPESNLYRFKENYNNTLEYGGYELDVGKHYDLVKNSYSGKKKGKGQDSSLKGEKRGIKGVIGGVADSLTGGFFNFDKRGNTKLQDFQQGTADTLTGGIFDFDKKGSNKLQRFQQGFMDAVTGNLTDFDRKGGKTVGPTRAITGIADFFTGNMFDLDKRGEFNLFGGGKKGKGINTYEKEEKKENKKILRDKDGKSSEYNSIKDSFQQKYDSLKEKASKIPMETTVNPDGSITSKGSGTLIGGELFTPGQPLTENQKMRIKFGLSMGNTYSEEIMESYNMKAIKSEKSIKPVIESDQKDLSSNIYQELDKTNVAVSEVLANGAQNELAARNGSSGFTGNTTEPQVTDAEVKISKANIPFIELLKNKTKKEFALSSDGSGGYMS